MAEKVVLASEILFQPANGLQSTRSLVKIHNTYPIYMGVVIGKGLNVTNVLLKLPDLFVE